MKRRDENGENENGGEREMVMAEVSGDGERDSLSIDKLNGDSLPWQRRFFDDRRDNEKSEWHMKDDDDDDDDDRDDADNDGDDDENDDDDDNDYDNDGHGHDYDTHLRRP